MSSPKDNQPELLMDLYELTMADSYLKEGMNATATFSLSIRTCPPHRSYFVAAGMDSLVQSLSTLAFSAPSLAYLKSLGIFSSALMDYLSTFRFTGSIRTLPEGSIFFAHEPILEVTAPLMEAQIIETMVINSIQLETLIATKALRCVEAARGRPVVDFSLRRTHGGEAGVKAARASYIAGFAGTSNLLAGALYSIPVYGTMAHSYITSFPTELEAFQAFARAFPRRTVLLIDTYDTLAGAQKAIETAGTLKAAGYSLNAVRLDSGNLADLSKEVRALLNQAELQQVQIMASGNLDEYAIQQLLEMDAPIDVFAVGTRMGVSSDSPYLDIAYKLVQYDGRPILKLSTGKTTWVGQKQIFRFHDDQGNMSHDILGLAGEEYPDGEPLLQPALRDGLALRNAEPLHAIRERLSHQLSTVPSTCRKIMPHEPYSVKPSVALLQLQEDTLKNILSKEIRNLPPA